MRHFLVAALALGAVVTVTAVQGGGSWTFDDPSAGRPPTGFIFLGGQQAEWVIRQQQSNGVLVKMQREQRGSQLALVAESSLLNLRLSARLQLGGSGSAGLAWRYRGAGSYYFASLDLEAGEVRIYRVDGGNRTRLENERDLEIAPGDWHQLKIEHRGSRIRVWINGVPVADARDRRHAEPGAIGFWATNDSEVSFDDLRAEPLKESQRRGPQVQVE